MKTSVLSRAITGLRRRTGLAAAVAAAAVAGLAPAGASAAGLSVALHAPSHQLQIGKTWVATATVTHNGQPVSGHVRYQMLAVTKVERTEPWIAFDNGTAREVFHTPDSSLERLAAKLKIPFTIHFEFNTPYGMTTANWVVLIKAPPASASAAAAGFTAKLHATSHTPIAGSYWPISLAVTKGTTKLNGSVNYEFLSGGQVVSHQKGHAFTKGAFSDRLCFPALAVGHPLKLGIVVTTKYGSQTLYWTVTTKTGKVTSPCKASP